MFSRRTDNKEIWHNHTEHDVKPLKPLHTKYINIALTHAGAERTCIKHKHYSATPTTIDVIHTHPGGFRYSLFFLFFYSGQLNDTILFSNQWSVNRSGTIDDVSDVNLYHEIHVKWLLTCKRLFLVTKLRYFFDLNTQKWLKSLFFFVSITRRQPCWRA